MIGSTGAGQWTEIDIYIYRVAMEMEKRPIDVASIDDAPGKWTELFKIDPIIPER